MVTVEFCVFGQPTVNKDLTIDEMDELLSKVVGAVKLNKRYDVSGSSLSGVTLRLNDGRYLSLTEENTPSWEGSSEGWINVSVYNEDAFQDLQSFYKKMDDERGM